MRGRRGPTGLLRGHTEQPATDQPEDPQARIEKTYRLSETETVKIVMVPGWPVGERCVIYSNAVSSTIQCREISPGHQR